jgi:hypothetical protein
LKALRSQAAPPSPTLAAGLSTSAKPFRQSGVDVIITIFCDFRQFSAEKNWRFSQKPMLSIKILQKFSFVLSRKQFFRRLFW